MKVWLMEVGHVIYSFKACADMAVWTHSQVNLSPNLSSGHFTDNRFLYEQVLLSASVMVVACKQSKL